MAIIHNNKRGANPTVTRTGQLRKKPDPKPSFKQAAQKREKAVQEPDDPPPPPRKRKPRNNPEKAGYAPLSKDYKKPLAMDRNLRGDGFGLYSCGNCKWFKEPCRTVRRPHKKITENGCAAAGVKETALPCSINRHGHGHFVPIEWGEQVKKVIIDHLASDELMLLQWRARKRMVELQYEKVNEFKIGQRVKYTLNDERHYGAIVRITKTRLQIEDDEGGTVTLKPPDVDNDDEPPASGQ